MPDIPRAIEDRLIDAQVQILRLDADRRVAVGNLIDDIARTVAGLIVAHDPTAVVRAAFQRERLNRLINAATEAIGTGYSDVATKLRTDLRDVMQLSVDLTARAMNDVIGVDLSPRRMSAADASLLTRELLIDGAPSADWWKQQARETTLRFAREMRLGMMQNETIDQLTRRVTGYQPRGKPRVSGMFDYTRKQAQALVRTSVLTAANAARTKMYEQNPDTVRGFQWIATLDTRTCAACFTGETPVTPLGSIRKVFQRSYDGDFLVITTAAGKQVTVTPRHPILTANGWLAADEIEPYQHVVYAVEREGHCVVCAEEIGVPPSIAEVADAFFDPAVAEISRHRSATHDFHGDGMGVDHHVDVAEVKRGLWANRIAGLLQSIGDNVLGAVEFGRPLLLRGLFPLDIIRCAPAVQTAKIAAALFEHGVEPVFAASGALENGLGPNAVSEHGQRRALIAQRGVGAFATPDQWHHANLLQQCGHGRRGHVVLPCQRCGRGTVTVAADDVVSVRRERRVCHVYNLETSRGSYIAGGLLVHNCGALDGKTWTSSYEPIGHKYPYPGPIHHWGCRCTTIPLLRDWETLLNGHKAVADIMAEMNPDRGTRASMGGQLPASTTYEAWFAKRPASVQREILGPSRFELYRSGKLGFSELVDMSGRPLTVAELRARVGQGV